MVVFEKVWPGIEALCASASQGCIQDFGSGGQRHAPGKAKLGGVQGHVLPEA